MLLALLATAVTATQKTQALRTLQRLLPLPQQQAAVLPQKMFRMQQALQPLAVRPQLQAPRMQRQTLLMRRMEAASECAALLPLLWLEQRRCGLRAPARAATQRSSQPSPQRAQLPQQQVLELLLVV